MAAGLAAVVAAGLAAVAAFAGALVAAAPVAAGFVVSVPDPQATMDARKATHTNTANIFFAINIAYTSL